jgi:hypothetical protein
MLVPPGDIPTKEDGLITPMANILFTKGVEKLLKNLDPTKASGPDNISTRILKETATEVVPCLVFSYLVFLIYLLWWSVVEFHTSGLI